MQIRRGIIPYRISSVTFSSISKLDSKLELDYFESSIERVVTSLVGLSRLWIIVTKRLVVGRVRKYHEIYEKYRNIENITNIIFFYILDISIFSIFLQKMKISNKLDYNSGCNTRMQYLMTISYQSFVPYVKFSFSRTILRCVRLIAWAVRLCLSSATLLRPPRGLKFSSIFSNPRDLGSLC